MDIFREEVQAGPVLWLKPYSNKVIVIFHVVLLTVKRFDMDLLN